MPVRTPSIDTLTTGIAPIFMQCQTSLATHRKNVVSLHKIQAQCAKINEVVPGRGIKLTGEKAFNDFFIDMVNRVLPIKKGILNADKVVKFIANFVAYAAEKAADTKKKEGGKKDDDGDDEDEDDDEETFASRFTAALLKHLLKGFVAKDKNVRYRVTQIVAEMILSLGEMDEELYTTLRAALLERVRDKETYVRLQAVIALARLQKGEDASEDADEDEQNLTEILLDVLQFDPVAEVRRAALLNLTPTAATLAPILTRTRDQDNVIRKMIYQHVLSTLPSPMILSIAQREEIIRHGLGDREPGVREAAGKLIGGWVDFIGGLEEFLKMLDVITSTVAEDALLSAFVTRPDLFNAVEFGDAYWTDITPEKAFLARIFVDHCIATKDDARLESSLPVVTLLAFRIQHEYNELMEIVSHDLAELANDDAESEGEMKKSDKEFAISELLKLAVNLDYADEIGRRKMFGLVRDMISQESLPELLVARCLDVLRKLSVSERDLIRVVVEVVQEMRDLDKDEEEAEGRDATESQFGDDRTDAGRPPQRAPVFRATEGMDEETKARMEIIDVRCLALCIGMLERVNSTLQENSSFHGLLPELIVPSVRSKKALLRERGLICLGLCCLIDRKMALSSFQLFVHQVQTAPKELKIKVLQILFDMLMVHEADLLRSTTNPQGESKIVEFLSHTLEDEVHEVQAVAAEGIAKLMLSGMVSDENVLTRLVLIYLSPETVDNQALRQCLTYFFPVYCYSSATNQKRMQRIFIPTFELLADVYRDLDDDQEMIPSSQIGLLLVDWTDPQKVVELKDQPADETIHVDVAIEITRALFNREMEKEDKKTFCQLLGKLYLPDTLDEDKARKLKLLTSSLQTRRPLHDTTTRNAFARFDKSLSKKYAEQLEGFSEEDFRQLESLKEISDWLDDMIPDEGEEIDITPKKKGARSSRSKTTTPAKGRKKAARKDSDSDPDSILDGSEDDDEAEPVEEQPTRRTPGRGAKARAKSVVEDEEDEEGDEEVEEEEEEEVPTRRRQPPAEEDDEEAEVESLFDEDDDE